MVRVPVAFQYIITNIQGQLNLTNASSTDITPMEAFELIEEYYTRETIGEVGARKRTNDTDKTFLVTVRNPGDPYKHPPESGTK
jgi:hypothetical protein